MAHNKVFGICENKCRVQVPPIENVYSKEEVNALLTGKSNTGHSHGDTYYDKSQINNFLNGKSDTGHNHDARYYTEAEINNLFADLLVTQKFTGTITDGNLKFNIAKAGYTALGIVGFTCAGATNTLYYMGLLNANTALLQFKNSGDTATCTVLYIKNIAA